MSFSTLHIADVTTFYMKTPHEDNDSDFEGLEDDDGEDDDDGKTRAYGPLSTDS